MKGLLNYNMNFIGKRKTNINEINPNIYKDKATNPETNNEKKMIKKEMSFHEFTDESRV